MTVQVRSRRRRFALAALLFGGLAAASGSAGAQEPPAAPPSVTVAPVRLADVSAYEEFIGRVEAIESVDLRARVEGFVLDKPFTEGDDVAAGELMFRIEPDRYEADLLAAEGELERARGRLREAELDLARQRTLVDRGAASQAVLDAALAAFESADGEVRIAQAAVRRARLSLDYTEVRTPIAGRVGAAQETPGNLVGPGSGPLARVMQLDPIRVVFSVSEEDLVRVRRENRGRPQHEVNAMFTPSLRLPDGEPYDVAGRIAFVDNAIDPGTATVAVRAEFPNPDALLLPGQFVNVVVQIGDRREAPVVPYAAVQEDREGHYVLVVDADDRVEERRITLGENTGDAFVAEAGLRPGEEVIVQGMQRAQPGMTVAPSRAVAPDRETADAARPGAPAGGDS